MSEFIGSITPFSHLHPINRCITFWRRHQQIHSLLVHSSIRFLEREAGDSQFAKAIIGGVPTASGSTELTLGESRRRNLQHPR
ncbi:hypothetical protein RHMOL_Rhmol09G0142400 [Rhododendron molle]|uniref:Uncharacterized protein n=1 Tax=Rhododendron molle TaxID=49168 RepID=A0ACC0MEB6_RHOML|nr:hypothetical protein RHMOL_Rhmol09G0142400 [Rhododendron molle]